MGEKLGWGKQTLMLNDKEVELFNTRITSLGVVDTVPEWVSPEPCGLSFDIPHVNVEPVLNVEPVFKSVLLMRKRLFSRRYKKFIKKYLAKVYGCKTGDLKMLYRDMCLEIRKRKR